ncbi:unnamed protein product [Rotaria sp. Silwood1]|nr:unnamed protein product [Rotaria sp. Silwood1]
MFFLSTGNNENYFKLIKTSMKTLFTTCDENNYDNLKEANLTRIQVELHRIIKHYPNVGSKALKGYFYHMA